MVSVPQANLISCLIGFVLSCFYKSNFSCSLLWLERYNRSFYWALTLSINTREAERAAIEPRSQVGSRKLEVGSWKWQVGSWKSEVGSRKSEVGRTSSAFVVWGFPETLFFYIYQYQYQIPYKRVGHTIAFAFVCLKLVSLSSHCFILRNSGSFFLVSIVRF